MAQPYIERSLEPVLKKAAAAARDPRGFLELYPAPAIFDEVQYAPDLLPYVKEKIDEDRGRSGQYLLTGSQNLALAEKVTESLAGRVAMLRLLPLSRREEEGRPRAPLAWERRVRPRASGKASFEAGIRNSRPSPAATPLSGTPAMPRPISNGICARSGRSAT